MARKMAAMAMAACLVWGGCGAAGAAAIPKGDWITEGVCSGSGLRWKTLHLVVEGHGNGKAHISGELNGQLVERDLSLREKTGQSANALALVAAWSLSAMSGGDEELAALYKELEQSTGEQVELVARDGLDVTFNVVKGDAVASCRFKPSWPEIYSGSKLQH